MRGKYERTSNRKNENPYKKQVKQFNRNGIQIISDRPMKPKYFPGEK